MNIKKLLGAGLVAGAVAISSIGAAAAAITIDGKTGFGFVGKGDVQYTFGWSNKQLQDNIVLDPNNGGVAFTYIATDTTVSEVSWECTNPNNGKIQVRERTTTTTRSTNGVVSAVARDGKKQITGINLNGWVGDPVVDATHSVTEGPAVNSCPPNSTLTPAGDPVIDRDASTSTGGLYVSSPQYQNGVQTLLLEKPAV